jgi:hypothetical protein
VAALPPASPHIPPHRRGLPRLGVCPQPHRPARITTPPPNPPPPPSLLLLNNCQLVTVFLPCAQRWATAPPSLLDKHFPEVLRSCISGIGCIAIGDDWADAVGCDGGARADRGHGGHWHRLGQLLLLGERLFPGCLADVSCEGSPTLLDPLHRPPPTHTHAQPNSPAPPSCSWATYC